MLVKVAVLTPGAVGIGTAYAIADGEAERGGLDGGAIIGRRAEIDDAELIRKPKIEAAGKHIAEIGPDAYIDGLDIIAVAETVLGFVADAEPLRLAAICGGATDIERDIGARTDEETASAIVAELVLDGKGDLNGIYIDTAAGDTGLTGEVAAGHHIKQAGQQVKMLAHGDVDIGAGDEARLVGGGTVAVAIVAVAEGQVGHIDAYLGREGYLS